LALLPLREAGKRKEAGKETFWPRREREPPKGKKREGTSRPKKKRRVYLTGGKKKYPPARLRRKEEREPRPSFAQIGETKRGGA